MGKAWESEQVIAEVQKSKTSKYKISVCQNDRGDVYVSAREWYKNQHMVDYAPGAQGMAIPISKAADVGKAIIEASKHLLPMEESTEVIEGIPDFDK